MTLDPTKPVQTRDGRKATLTGIFLEGRTLFPNNAVITNPDGVQWICSYTQDWMCNDTGVESPHDLINIPEPRKPIHRKVWVNVYRKNYDWVLHISKEVADSEASPNRIACVPLEINCHEGDGL